MQNQSSNSELDALAEELTLRREINEYGTIRYYNEYGEQHRIHGPAIIYTSGIKYWYQNDKRHRLDGPAVIFTNGDSYWFINGMQYIEKDFNAHPLVIAHRAKNAL